MTILDFLDFLGIAVMICTAILLLLSLKASKENAYRLQKYSMILYAVYVFPCSCVAEGLFWGLLLGSMVCFAYFGIVSSLFKWIGGRGR